MLAVFRLDQPMDVDARMDFTMPLSDWCALRKQLDKTDGPIAHQVKGAIDDLVTRAKQSFSGVYEKQDYENSIRQEDSDE
jgi:hypothetical protein